MVGLSLLNSMNPQHVKNHYDRHIVGLYLLLNALMLMWCITCMIFFAQINLDVKLLLSSEDLNLAFEKLLLED